jgi:hypothetical protein
MAKIPSRGEMGLDGDALGGSAAPRPPVVAGGGQWTVMVFMGAATISGNVPLAEAADADIAEMKSVGSTSHLNVFAQLHGDGVPRRSHVGVSAMQDVPVDERNPARGAALESFLRWSLRTARHDPANRAHYAMLVLWGHAYDFAFGREKTGGGTVEALDFAELSTVLERLQQEFGVGGKAALDILAFDACDLATMEMACQLEPFADYLLGSQIGIPIPGWPYDRVLDRLRSPIGRLMSPAELGAYVVRRFCESYTATHPVSLSFLDLKRVSELSAHGEVLAETLMSATADRDTLGHIAQLFSQSNTGEGRPFVDLADLCLTLARGSGDPFVAEAARALGDFLISPRPPLVGESAEGVGRPFVVEHGRNAGHTARLNGISVYAPHVAPAIDFEAVQHLYHNFVFAKETRWSELVHRLARLC